MLIRDIIPANEVEYDTIGWRDASKLSTEDMVKELWTRGVDIKEVFRLYIAMEAQAEDKTDQIFGNDEEGQHGRPRITVGDARDLGVAEPSINYDQPF